MHESVQRRLTQLVTRGSRVEPVVIDGFEAPTLPEGPMQIIRTADLGAAERGRERVEWHERSRSPTMVWG